MRALSLSKEKDVDTPPNAREPLSQRQCIRDAYLLGRVLAKARPRSIREDNNFDLDEYLGPIRLAQLVKALEEGNRTITSAILRGWGVR